MASLATELRARQIADNEKRIVDRVGVIWSEDDWN